MKESVGTLRVYLGLVALFNGVSSAWALLSPSVTVFPKIFAVLYLGVSLALLYVAVALPTLVHSRGPLVVGIFRVFVVTAALSLSLVLMDVLVGTMGAQSSPDAKPLVLAVLPSALRLAIAVYLSRSIVRLVGEAKAPSLPS